MLRTFLIAARDEPLPADLLPGIRRVASLYRARVIVLKVTARGEPPAASRDTASLDGSGPTAAAVPAETHIVRPGQFIDVLCDLGHEADVICVWHHLLFGPDGRTSPDELANLVRLAPRPIWLMREPVRCPEHIVVAYDGSAHSGRALHMAANLAETLGVRLTVLNVDESRDAAAQDAILARAAGYCEPYRVTIERVGLFGRAAESIQAYVRATSCGLLVVGAAGVGYLRGLLFGSVAGQLITAAPCSVLVAK